MAQRTVVWTRTADVQLVGVLEYWLKRNKSNTFPKKLVGLVSERIKHITENPFIYKSSGFPDTRVATMGNFSIFYKVSDEQIIITAFWDNRQDPKELLKILADKA